MRDHGPNTNKLNCQNIVVYNKIRVK